MDEIQDFIAGMRILKALLVIFFRREDDSTIIHQLPFMMFLQVVAQMTFSLVYY